MPSEKGCENSDKNPMCPYLTKINQCANDIAQVKMALIGEDMQSGLVSRVKELQAWTNIVKPIAISVVTAIIVGMVIKLV